MNSPFVLISTWKFKEGGYDAYADWFPGLMERIHDGNPRMVAFHSFANLDGSRLMGVQVHPDVASMDRQLEIVADYAEVAINDFLEAPIDLLVAGDGDETRERTRVMATARDLQAFPVHVGGFTRSSAEA